MLNTKYIDGWRERERELKSIDPKVIFLSVGRKCHQPYSKHFVTLCTTFIS